MDNQEIVKTYKLYREVKKKWEKVSKTLKSLEDTCEGFFKFSKFIKYTTLKDEKKEVFKDLAEYWKLSLKKINPDALNLVSHEKLVSFFKAEGIPEGLFLMDKTYEDFRHNLPGNIEIEDCFNKKEVIKILENKK